MSILFKQYPIYFHPLSVFKIWFFIYLSVLFFYYWDFEHFLYFFLVGFSFVFYFVMFLIFLLLSIYTEFIFFYYSGAWKDHYVRVMYQIQTEMLKKKLQFSLHHTHTWKINTFFKSDFSNMKDLKEMNGCGLKTRMIQMLTHLEVFWGFA